MVKIQEKKSRLMPFSADNRDPLPPRKKVVAAWKGLHATWPTPSPSLSAWHFCLHYALSDLTQSCAPVCLLLGSAFLINTICRLQTLDIAYKPFFRGLGRWTCPWERFYPNFRFWTLEPSSVLSGINFDICRSYIVRAIFQKKAELHWIIISSKRSFALP